MPYVIKIVGLAGITGNPFRTLRDMDRYVKEYDPAALGGRGNISLVTDVRQARRFNHASDALAYWRQEHGVRPDGQPNRPLTAYTIEVLPVPA